MPTAVVMPQMGESIAEGTIVRWIKKVGDAVKRDEPLFEISTDKVDAEIPAPAAGILTEINVREGETVAIDTVVGMIGEAGDIPTADQGDGASRTIQAPPEAAPTGPRPVPVTARSEAPSDEGRRRRSSPLVRRIAGEHDVDISDVPGSGVGGRVTKRDLLEYIERGAGKGAPRLRPVPTTPFSIPSRPQSEPTEGAVIEVMSVMRRKIADHMVLSRRTSAHVHTVFHVDFSRVDRLRSAKKDEYLRRGVKLTFLAFIAKAVVDVLRRYPVLNASVEGERIVHHHDVNLGIAVALEVGLIVPVIRNADERNMLGLSRVIMDLATRGRAKQLKPEEVQGGTFTITNPGQLGAQFGMPIINQPQVAILCVGTVEKRPVVIDDAIAIRTMSYLALGFDHRIIDGAVADSFMADIKYQLEHFDSEHV